MSFVEELTWRGLLSQVTDPKLSSKMASEKMVGYAGFDPTADSLHVGSLLPALALRRLQLAGHTPIAVVGGATGMIGDPSGKSEERNFLSEEQLQKNVAGVRAQLERFVDFGGGAKLVNNYDWTRDMSYLQFLRDIGKSFSIGMMLGKESVRLRLEKESGISYTEFSYMLLQAFDFLQLYRQYGCKLQVGGSDQWGNITAGIDLIRRLESGESYGLTMPLVMTAAGTKFGKTEKGTVWLAAERTSPYEFYQFFMQTEDRDVGRFLRYFTFLDEKTIVALEETLARAPEKREAQRVLAREVTTLVHGAAHAAQAEEATRALFQRESSADGKLLIPPGAPVVEEGRASFDAGFSLVDALVKGGLATSKSGARRDIEGGGVNVNDERISDVARLLVVSDIKDGAILLRKGKKSYCVIKVV